jgi:hypothetical protein
VGNAMNTHGQMTTNNVEGMRLNMNVHKKKWVGGSKKYL